MGRRVVAVRRRTWKLLLPAVALACLLGVMSVPGAGAAMRPRAVGSLDCNGNSLIQRTLKRTGACTDLRALTRKDSKFSEDGRFYDNGVYIGHDEPDMTFLSSKPGSGNDVTWTETLPRDPTAPPTVAHPGSDVSHFFELSIAPWFSMALCNPNSFPQRACDPLSDKNAPECIGLKCSLESYPGGGSSFTEVQFYPPGFAPFVDSESCDNTHWCASLHINDLECKLNVAATAAASSRPTSPSSRPRRADRAGEPPGGEYQVVHAQRPHPADEPG